MPTAYEEQLEGSKKIKDDRVKANLDIPQAKVVTPVNEYVIAITFLHKLKETKARTTILKASGCACFTSVSRSLRWKGISKSCKILEGHHTKEEKNF